MQPRATDDPAALGPQDYVIISLKSHQAPGEVGRMQPLLGPETTVATAMNGVPWWYFYKLSGPHREPACEIGADPDGAQWDGIGPERAIGCITYVAAGGDCARRRKVRCSSGRYFIGEPDGSGI